jgi:hypothetical protein
MPTRSLRRHIAPTLRRSTIMRVPVVLARHRGVDERDAVLASYPKSGNTWLKFMLADLLTGAEIDFEAADGLVPSIGAHEAGPRRLPTGGRLIKSHEPYRHVYGRRYGRVIHLVRDGRDTAVSYYFHELRRRGSWEGEHFSRFLELFLAGRLDGYGVWHEHVRSWLDGRAAERTRLVRYEDVLVDPLGELRGIAEFLELEVSDGALGAAVERNDFARMRDREEASTIADRWQRRDIRFIRRGASGGWRELFEPEDRERFAAVAGDVLDRLGYADEPR